MKKRKPTLEIKVSDNIQIKDTPIVKGGGIQTLPTSGTTTVTPEMAESLRQLLG